MNELILFAFATRLPGYGIRFCKSVVLCNICDNDPLHIF